MRYSTRALDLDPATVRVLGAAERALGQLTGTLRAAGRQGQPPPHQRGRVGRLLIPLLLCTYERIEQPALYLSPHLERHRTQYTDLMLRVSRTGDHLSWVRFFIEAVEGSALESITRGEALLALRERYHARLHSARSSAHRESAERSAEGRAEVARPEWLPTEVCGAIEEGVLDDGAQATFELFEASLLCDEQELLLASQRFATRPVPFEHLLGSSQLPFTVFGPTNA